MASKAPRAAPLAACSSAKSEYEFAKKTFDQLNVELGEWQQYQKDNAETKELFLKGRENIARVQEELKEFNVRFDAMKGEFDRLEKDQ